MLTRSEDATRRVVSGVQLPTLSDAGAFADCVRVGVAPCFSAEPGALRKASGFLGDPDTLRVLLLGVGAGFLLARGANAILLALGLHLAKGWLDGSIARSVPRPGGGN